MAATKQLAAAVRSGTGKGAARKTRREGRVPGVIYGGGEPPEAISLDYRDTHKHIYAGHFLTTIFELDIDGRRERVVPRDYQLDVVKDVPLHVDFLRLKAGSRLKISVPVHFVNTEAAPGIKRGGTLNVVLHALDLLVPGDRIPDAIEADVGSLDINDSLRLEDIKLPEGCRPADRRASTIATVAPPTTLSDAEVSAEAAAAAEASAKSGAAKAPAPVKAPAKGAAPAKAPAAGGKK